MEPIEHIYYDRIRDEIYLCLISFNKEEVIVSYETGVNIYFKGFADHNSIFLGGL